MEPLKKENFFEKYEYLEKLLKHYSYKIDRDSMNMEGYLILIHRIIFNLSRNFNQKMVE